MPDPSLNSFNDEQLRRSELRHLFLPGTYGLVSETIVAVVALVLLNLSTLNDEVFSAGSGINADPLSLWGNLFNKTLGRTQHVFVQEVLLFLLWAVVGALVYILAFRFLQIFLRTRRSVSQGASLIQTEHSQGAMRYLASLHDVFLKLLIALGGTAAILTGGLICFAIASQKLSDGLDGTLPGNLVDLLLAFIGALLAVRVIVIGLSLLSPRFRLWYNA